MILNTAGTALAETVNMSYGDYRADINALNGSAEEIGELIAECEARGLTTDYETMRLNIIERFTGYMRSELINGVSFRTTENGYTKDDVKSIYDNNAASLKSIAEKTISDLNAYLSGEKTPREVPEILTSKTEIDGKTLYAETEADGITEKSKVFLNGVGHYSAYEDMDFLKATGSDIIQMEIGMSEHCEPASGVKDWIAGWYQKPDAGVVRTSEESRSGSCSIKFTNKTPQTTNYYFNLTQAVKVEPETTYIYSFWAKGENINAFVYKTLSDNTFKWLAANENKTIGDWTKYSVMYTTGKDQTEDRVYLSTEGKTDAIYIDDVSLVRAGSSENLLKNGSFEEADDPGKVIDSDPGRLWKYEEIFKEAEEKNMKISLLLSPQYFVNELFDIYPDLKDNGDGIGYVLLHPAAAEAVSFHVKTIAALASKYSCINDICLANEPRNETKYGGSNSYYKPMWTEFLIEKYGSAEALNSAWGTSYANISDAPFASGVNNSNKQSLDYVEFNDSVMTEWIKLMSETAHEAAPDIPVHIKTMPYVAWADEGDKRWLIGAGVDPEKISGCVDINGNDADLRFLSDSTMTYSDYIDQKRVQQSFWYEFQSSLNEAPVFNSEDHIIANGNKDFGTAHEKLMEASQWMGAVHGRNMDCMWTWERNTERAETYESIKYRPGVYEKMSEVNLDLKRLADEVYALIDAPYDIGILYSKTARVYSRAYINAAYKTFEYSLYNGVKAGFVSENDLSKLRDYKLIAVPLAEHVTADVVSALKSYVQNGGKLIILGENSLSYDENGNAHNASDLAYIRQNAVVVPAYGSGYYAEFDENSYYSSIENAVNELLLTDVEIIDKTTGKRAADVEYTSVDYNGKKLINICNYDWNGDKSIRLRINGEDVETARELRSDEYVSGSMTLKSYKPVLVLADYPGTSTNAAKISNVTVSGGKVSFDVTARRTIQNASAIAAAKNNDGSLYGVRLIPVSEIERGSTQPFEADFGAAVSDKNISVMLWDNLNNMTPLAEASAPDGNIIYSQSFNEENSIKDFTTVRRDVLPGAPDIEYDSQNGCMTFEAWGQNTGMLLPEYLTPDNFVMEADITYSKTKEHLGNPAAFGFIFGYGGGKFTSLSYNPETGTVIMGNLIGGEVKSRYAEKGNGASVMIGENETVSLKLAVNGGFMEFFVNGELCYTFDSRISDVSNDFCEGGRLGIFSKADKTMISVDNITVRSLSESDGFWYSNAYMTPNDSGGFANISELTNKLADSAVINSHYGSVKYEGAGWENTASYIPVPVSGNYSVDINFAFNNPLNDSRYFGIAFGIKGYSDGISYNVAAVKENGDMFIQQKRSADGNDDKIAGSNGAEGSCSDTIPPYKKNTDGKANYLLSYMPPGFAYTTESDTNNRRHTLHLEVKDGTAALTCEGTSISCKTDINGTDGYIGIRAAGTGAYIYSVRVAPL